MRHIVITGASSGIGRGVAERFLAEGWAVTLIARRREALEALASGHAHALALPADVTVEAQVEAAFAAATARFGRIDVLFNNAGMFGPMGPIDEIAFDDWRRVVDLNLSGMFLCARAAFRQMRRQSPQGGRIINNGSVSAYTPRPGSVAYTATKHAVTGLTKTLALDGRAFDIAAGQIDIGNARTELLESVAARTPGDPPPMMEVADVAAAVLYMASLPLSANVLGMTVMATKMPFVGRG
ncbi:MAG: SDR family oxidoreductase [Rhodobacteraceae bacterium]|nr:SDR family oxidoreductase [Paracoccaceae bacterium]